jgi:hypothetical protein
MTEVTTTAYIVRDSGTLSTPVLIPVTAVFSYSPDDPYAIKVTFRHEHDASVAVWQFGRDLLDAVVCGEELESPGDVWGFIQPDENQLYLGFTSDREASALLQFDMAVVRQFLVLTYTQVPRGQESVDVDAAICKILEDA